MKLIALIFLLLLIAASATGVMLAYHSILPRPDADGLQTGLWLLIILHLAAACIMTGIYLVEDKH